MIFTERRFIELHMAIATIVRAKNPETYTLTDRSNRKFARQIWTRCDIKERMFLMANYMRTYAIMVSEREGLISPEEAKASY